MMGKHKSDSSEQRSAERYMLRKIGLSNQAQQPTLLCGAQVKLDGFDEKRRILCEVYAHIGLLKPGQVHKVAGDILKMLLVENDLGGRWRKIYCFADKTAANKLSDGSWLAHAAKRLGVEPVVVQLPKRMRVSIQKAQHRQTR